MCYPFGAEYMWMHRAYRQLAALYSRAGFHVLRFDLCGCGDSASPPDGVSIEQWVADTAFATEELRETSGAEKIAVFGFRLGATIAALHAAESGAAKTEALVLWDPVMNGDDYLAELRQLQETWLARSLPQISATKPWDEGREGYLGFPIEKKLGDSMKRIDLRKIKPQCSHLGLFQSNMANANMDILRQTTDPEITKTHFESVETSKEWAQSGGLDPLSIPSSLLQKMVDWTAEVVK